ncbi:hypothetical protein OG216_39865 [Streptomycetaceae bacterium NBC_01309]
MRDGNNLASMLEGLLVDEPPASVDIAQIKVRGRRVRRTARIRIAAASTAGAALLGGAVLATSALAGGSDGSGGPAGLGAASSTATTATTAADTPPTGTGQQPGTTGPNTGSPFDAGGQAALAAVRAHLPPGIVAVDPVGPNAPYAFTLTRADGGRTQLSFATGNSVAPGSAPADPCDPDLPPVAPGVRNYPFSDCVTGVLPSGAKTVTASRTVLGDRASVLYIVTPDGKARGLQSGNRMMGSPGSSETLSDAPLLTPEELTALASEPDVYAALVGAAADADAPVGDGTAPSPTAKPGT